MMARDAMRSGAGSALVLAMAVGSVAATAARADEPDGAPAGSGPTRSSTSRSARPGGLLDRLPSEPRPAACSRPSRATGSALASDRRTAARAVVDAVAGKLGTTRDKALRDLTGGGIVLAVEGRRRRAGSFLIVTPTRPGLPARRPTTPLLDLAREDAAAKGKPDPVDRGRAPGDHGL